MSTCDICRKKDRLCGVGAGATSCPAIRISWCARPACIAAARAKISAAEKAPRLHFVSMDRWPQKRASRRWSLVARPVVHIRDPFLKRRTVCGVELDATPTEYHESVFDARGCRSCARMRGSAEERLGLERVPPAPASSVLSNQRSRRRARGLLSNSPPASSSAFASSGLRIEHAGKVTLQQKKIRCGKPHCTKLHGPYWYAFYKDNGRTVSRYIGRALPAVIEADPRFTRGDR
jgi:hypothetical protein